MPVKFEIYRGGVRVNDFAPQGAYAVGPESVPIPGAVTFQDGLLITDPPDVNAAGVALLWDMGELGSFHLETTRLVPRDKPYNLNVELARLRLMKIVQKQEDWNLFDFPKADPFIQRFREAQDLFSDALGKMDEPAEAATLADRSLALSVALSEDLAMFHAELLINRRRATSAFVKHLFGCRVDFAMQNQRYREMLADSFDYAVLPMSWKLLQPQEGAFDTEVTDTWIAYLAKRRVPVLAGPIINLVERDVPHWMFIWENDLDSLREMVYEQVQRVVSRYRRSVVAWNVVGGLCTNSVFSLTFEQMIELTRLLVTLVKIMISSARTLITITQPFGEYHARNPNSVSPMLYAEMLGQAGINFEGFALELELGLPQPGMFARDLFQISTLLDRFSTIGRPVFLTAVSFPGRHTPDPADRSEGRMDPAAAGRWKRPWDAQLQADFLEAVYRIALSKPFVENVAWGNLVDVNQSVPGGGLLDEMYQPKPAFTRLQEMRELFRAWQAGRK